MDESKLSPDGMSRTWREDRLIVYEQTKAVQEAGNYKKYTGYFKQRIAMTGIMAGICIIMVIVLFSSPWLTAHLDGIGDISGATYFEWMDYGGRNSITQFKFFMILVPILLIGQYVGILIAWLVFLIKCSVNNDEYSLLTYRKIKYNSVKRKYYEKGWWLGGREFLFDAIQSIFLSVVLLIFMIYDTVSELNAMPSMWFIFAMLLCVVTIVLAVIDKKQRRKLVKMIANEPKEWKTAYEVYLEQQRAKNALQEDKTQETTDVEEKQ